MISVSTTTKRAASLPPIEQLDAERESLLMRSSKLSAVYSSFSGETLENSSCLSLDAHSEHRASHSLPGFLKQLDEHYLDPLAIEEMKASLEGCKIEEDRQEGFGVHLEKQGVWLCRVTSNLESNALIVKTTFDPVQPPPSPLAELVTPAHKQKCPQCGIQNRFYQWLHKSHSKTVPCSAPIQPPVFEYTIGCSWNRLFQFKVRELRTSFALFLKEKSIPRPEKYLNGLESQLTGLDHGQLSITPIGLFRNFRSLYKQRSGLLLDDTLTLRFEFYIQEMQKVIEADKKNQREALLKWNLPNAHYLGEKLYHTYGKWLYKGVHLRECLYEQDLKYLVGNKLGRRKNQSLFRFNLFCELSERVPTQELFDAFFRELIPKKDCKMAFQTFQIWKQDRDTWLEQQEGARYPEERLCYHYFILQKQAIPFASMASTITSDAIASTTGTARMATQGS